MSSAWGVCSTCELTMCGRPSVRQPGRGLLTKTTWSPLDGSLPCIHTGRASSLTAQLVEVRGSWYDVQVRAM